jgi:S1-C subfamily serine protease
MHAHVYVVLPQVDSAINPGNSGGPAFADLETGAVAGVAFSKTTGTSTDNIGYVIPWPVVRHFLREYEEHGLYRWVSAFATFFTR